MPTLLDEDAAWVFVGSGDPRHESFVRNLTAAFPTRVGSFIGFSEPLAHLVEAGADLFLMPSRFEPCGLNQMYSQRYGTPPVAHATGGLSDSIVDCTPATLAAGTATGFLFLEPTTEALLAAVERAIAAYHEPATWRSLQRNGMARDFGWHASAARYAALYRSLA